LKNSSLTLAIMLATLSLGGLSLSVREAVAQIDNPIVSYACSGEGVSNCTNSTVSTVGGVDLIDLNISGVCQSGATPATSQYAYTDKCSKIYELEIYGYIEDDTFENDDCEFDTIGEVDADAAISPIGGSVLETTYSGETCEGAVFESSPGSVLESPC